MHKNFAVKGFIIVPPCVFAVRPHSRGTVRSGAHGNLSVDETLKWHCLVFKVADHIFVGQGLRVWATVWADTD